MSYLDREGGVGRAVITVGVANSCLELCNADERSQGQPVGTLDAALAILPKQQQVKGKRTAEVFDLHADDASLGIAQLPEPIVPEQPLEQAVEAAPAAREEGLTESASQQEAVRRDEKATAASVPKDPRIAAAVLSIRSGDSAVEQREALLEVLDDEIRGPADWADAWVDHGLLEVRLYVAFERCICHDIPNGHAYMPINLDDPFQSVSFLLSWAKPKTDPQCRLTGESLHAFT